MKNYFNTVLPNMIKSHGVNSTYLNVLTRTSISGLFVGHPGVVNEGNYEQWKHSPYNALKVCFPFTHVTNKHHHNAVYEMLIKDIVVLGKSTLSDIKPIKTRDLSVTTLRNVTRHLGDDPVVFETIGQLPSMNVAKNIYKFIYRFRYVHMCNRMMFDYSDKYNHSLFIEIYPMNLCIPIYDTTKVDGFGIAIKLVNDSGSIIKCDAILVSQHKSNLSVVDGDTVCNISGIPTDIENNLIHTANIHCARTKSSRTGPRDIFKTKIAKRPEVVQQAPHESLVYRTTKPKSGDALTKTFVKYKTKNKKSGMVSSIPELPEDLLDIEESMLHTTPEPQQPPPLRGYEQEVKVSIDVDGDMTLRKSNRPSPKNVEWKEGDELWKEGDELWEIKNNIAIKEIQKKGMDTTTRCASPPSEKFDDEKTFKKYNEITSIMWDDVVKIDEQPETERPKPKNRKMKGIKVQTEETAGDVSYVTMEYANGGTVYGNNF